MSANINKPALQRSYVWSGWLRLCHWLFAISVSGLWITAWLHQNVIRLFEVTYDYHILFGYLLSGTLLLRLYLLFSARNSAAHWKDLWPGRQQWRAVLATLRFYVSLGRTPLPRWYAHNPLWGIVYLLLFLALLVQILMGFLMYNELDVYLNIYHWHAGLARWLGGFIVLHILAVFVHDLKSGNSDVSAMIHGYRVFRLEQPDLSGPVQAVSLDKLKAGLKTESKSRPAQDHSPDAE